MRRLIIWIVGLLVLFGALFFTYRYLEHQGDPGFLVFGYGRWSLETTLLFGGTILLLTFVALYFVVRLLLTAFRLPRILQRFGQDKRAQRSQESLLAGLIESAEGNWETAEKHLIRHAANSGTPLINYLTAARAAHFRGAVDQRDEYLELARETMPDAELAIGLTKAELQLSNRQFEEALENLTELNEMAPSHAAVLKLMHQAYTQMEDWEAVSRLLPQLHKNKVMMEAEIKLLEIQSYSSLLKQRAQLGDADALREVWQIVPPHVRSVLGVQEIYYAAMIECGVGGEIEEPLAKTLDRDWNETLLVLFGCIKSPNPVAQLARAEGWLRKHRDDAVLQRVIGRLAFRAQQTDKARDYLESSLSIEESAEAYQLLGDLLYQRGDMAGACTYFRKGLVFVSDEFVAQFEQQHAGAEADAEIPESDEEAEITESVSSDRAD